MEDFCTKCTKELFGEEIAPTIDVFKEFELLEPGMCYSGRICEGCGLINIKRTEDNELKVIRIADSEEIYTWTDY